MRIHPVPEKKNVLSHFVIQIAVVCVFLQSCAYIKEITNDLHDRKHKSVLRFGNHIGNLNGIIRTDGIWVYHKQVWELCDSIILARVYFDDGTVFKVKLLGNMINRIKPGLEGFDIRQIQSDSYGLYTIVEGNQIYEEVYTQFMLYLYPRRLGKYSVNIIDSETLCYYNDYRDEMDTLVFVPCSPPITHHNPFKSKKWLWKDEKERDMYLNEWKRIKSEREKSKIKYSYYIEI